MSEFWPQVAQKKYYFHRTLLAMSGCPTREATKKLYTLQEPLVGGNRHDTGGTGSRMCQKFVKSGLSFLKLMITIKHVTMMQILYLDIWSMFPLTGASYKLGIQVTSLGCSKTCQFKRPRGKQLTTHYLFPFFIN